MQYIHHSKVILYVWATHEFTWNGRVCGDIAVKEEWWLLIKCENPKSIYFGTKMFSEAEFICRASYCRNHSSLSWCSNETACHKDGNTVNKYQICYEGVTAGTIRYIMLRFRSAPQRAKDFDSLRRHVVGKLSCMGTMLVRFICCSAHCPKG